MLVRVYKPFVRINDEQEFQINISEDLRMFLETHPKKDGDIDLFSIDIEKKI